MVIKDTTNLTISVKGYSVSPEGEAYIHDDVSENIIAHMGIEISDCGDNTMKLELNVIGMWDEYRLFRALEAVRRNLGDKKYAAAAVRSIDQLLEEVDKD